MPLPPKIQTLSVAVVGKPKSASVVATPEQARTESVNNLLALVYAKASTLELSADEIKKLTADFEDREFYRGANGNENLIYLNHQSIRMRLNNVIGVGKWVMLIRRSWAEDYFTAKKEQATRVYVEGVLIVRGCFVSEAIGDGSYYKNNPSGNYGDSYESAKSITLRRCAKEFGIGLQAWSKDFQEAWKKKYSGFNRPK